MPAAPVPVAPERVQASALVLVLVAHPVPVDLAVLLDPVEHRPPARHRVRNVPLPAEAVADARSIRRPKKVQ